MYDMKNLTRLKKPGELSGGSEGIGEERLELPPRCSQSRRTTATPFPGATVVVVGEDVGPRRDSNP